MKTLRNLYELFRIMMKLGGPFGVLLYKHDGSLERRIRELRL